MKRVSLAVVMAVGLLCASLLIPQVRHAAHPLIVRVRGRSTLHERLAQIGPGARADLQSLFDAAAVPYPPKRIVLLGLKQERVLELHAAASGEELRFVHTFPILGASGGAGPKLAEGDRQVPEGIYRIEGLNPNSRFHLSLRVDYPNRFDRLMATRDGRTNLGGDIFIHGGRASVGCLAMGDPSIEQLFVLCADVGLDNVDLILAPCDLRRRPAADLPTQPAWVGELHREVADAMGALELLRSWRLRGRGDVHRR